MHQSKDRAFNLNFKTRVEFRLLYDITSVVMKRQLSIVAAIVREATDESGVLIVVEAIASGHIVVYS